jgi:hypothetical protein
MSRGVKKVVPVVKPTGFVIGLAEIGELLRGHIVPLQNRSERQCVLMPARHILAGQPVKEPESYEFACL